jgi:hypothetical protein
LRAPTSWLQAEADAPLSPFPVDDAARVDDAAAPSTAFRVDDAAAPLSPFVSSTCLDAPAGQIQSLHPTPATIPGSPPQLRSRNPSPMQSPCGSDMNSGPAANEHHWFRTRPISIHGETSSLFGSPAPESPSRSDYSEISKSPPSPIISPPRVDPVDAAAEPSEHWMRRFKREAMEDAQIDGVQWWREPSPTGGPSPTGSEEVEVIEEAVTTPDKKNIPSGSTHSEPKRRRVVPSAAVTVDPSAVASATLPAWDHDRPSRRQARAWDDEATREHCEANFSGSRWTNNGGGVTPPPLSPSVLSEVNVAALEVAKNPFATSDDPEDATRFTRSRRTLSSLFSWTSSPPR